MAALDAERYLDGTVRAHGGIKDPEKIAADIAKKQADRLEMAALDIDLARITGYGVLTADMPEPLVTLCEDEEGERAALMDIAQLLKDGPSLITYNGFAFDLPLAMRRARYMSVKFPWLNLDRYRSEHRDLCEDLCDRNPQRRRSLSFYVKRLGMTDLRKTLSGAEEAQVPVTGQWEALRESLHHDVTATYRIARWLGVIS